MDLASGRASSHLLLLQGWQHVSLDAEYGKRQKSHTQNLQYG